MNLVLRDIVLRVILLFDFIVSFFFIFRSSCLSTFHHDCGKFQYVLLIALFVYYLRVSCVNSVGRRSFSAVVHVDVPIIVGWMIIASSYLWPSIL
jgi:hypothetical protein